MNPFELIYKYSNKDVMSLMAKFIVFTEVSVPKIYGYHSGSDDYDQTAFSYMTSLYKEVLAFNTAISHCSHHLNDIGVWDIVEAIDDIRIDIETIMNLDKWTKSDRFMNNVIVNAVLKDRQTIESLTSEYGYDGEGWVAVAIENGLSEEMYTTSGGNIIRMEMSGDSGIFIDDVIDIPAGNNMMGKDIKKSFEYIDNDIAVVSGDDCIYQCYEILIGLKRGDIFDKQDIGMSAIVGGNMASFSYPMITRQLHRTFSTDSSVKAVYISEFLVSDDVVTMNVNIESKFGLYIKRGVSQ